MEVSPHTFPAFDLKFPPDPDDFTDYQFRETRYRRLTPQPKTVRDAAYGEENKRLSALHIRHPATILTGSRNEHLVLNIDFAPTLLDFAGAAVPVDMPGRSIAPRTGRNVINSSIFTMISMPGNCMIFRRNRPG